MIKEKTIRNIALQLLLTVDLMHRNDIIHRDLKPDNILINSNSNEDKIDLRLADFGFAIEYEVGKDYQRCGTPNYIPPEVLIGKPFDTKVDIFSIGSIIYKLISGKPLINGRTALEIMKKTISNDFSMDI